MKKILGLDLGTNSIGWAFIEEDFDNKTGSIKGIGSRIIPMTQDVLGKFDAGNSISQTAERTGYRGVRRLNQRHLLRRERLHRVLHILGFLPKHYEEAIDFEKHLGQFKKGREVKLNYRRNEKDKHQFIFMDSFNEMINDFKEKNHANIPLDFTLYYLRSKALTEKISKEELAWILLNFNQKRGYYQLRGEEEEENDNKVKTFEVLKVQELIDSGEIIQKTGEVLYDVVFTNGWQYDKQITKTENWEGKTKEFIVTTSQTKDGNTKRTYKAVDSEKDWIAIKKKTEQDIEQSEKTVGQYIYEVLVQNPKQKINGKLVKTIERKYYKNELIQILKKQSEFHPELKNASLYQKCLDELYPRNEQHQNQIKNKDFNYLFIDDIIFYQRPLKSKKSTISECPYETKNYYRDGKKQHLKCIPKSHPLFQEFRLWQFIRNLKVLQKEATVNEKLTTNLDVTEQLFQTEEDWVKCFAYLNDRKEIEQKQFLKYLSDNKYIRKHEEQNYRWNYIDDRKYPCNETRATFLSRLKKNEEVDVASFLTPSVEYHLWHIIYSVKDPKEFETALKTFARKNGLNVDVFVKNFIKHPPYKSDYGAYSEKAIKKLLPLMRQGSHWDEEDITEAVKDRVNAIIKKLERAGYDKNKLDEISDDDIPTQLLKSFLPFKDKNPFQGLNTYQACYAVYNRHSEASDISCWHKPEDIDNYLHNFRQHSLRNPIVEQVVTETLRTVRDIWRHYGKEDERLFDEIHIELGREMKNPAEKRKRITEQNTVNENTNERIRKLLVELKNDSNVKGDIKPYSPSQQEILKIYEDGIYQSSKEIPDYVEKTRKNHNPTQAEIQKYKLWLEQNYISPYTGKPITLSKLFTTDYQIEHVIPQSRFFDNSLNNKVICESVVNQEKGNMTGYEFILKCGGSHIGVYDILRKEEYEAHCKNSFKGKKLDNLLSEDIPESFTNRQLNDSRYISKFIKGVLSNLVRDEEEQEATSKHMVPVVGAITAQLKKDWGLNDKWNEIVAPRFQRLNEMTDSQDFGHWDKNINAFRTQVPDDLQKGFKKKRIDHRHHALDALVIACTAKDHINYITSINTERKNHSLVKKLRRVEVKKIGGVEKNVALSFHQPWDKFVIDAKKSLENTIVSFKQNNRVINKTTNYYQKYVLNNGSYTKKTVAQEGINWAIRKPLHQETVHGKVKVKQKKSVNLNKALEEWQNIVEKPIRRIIKKKHAEIDDIKKLRKYFKENPIQIDNKEIKTVEIYYWEEGHAVRKDLSEIKNRKHWEKITDSGIKSILNNHLSRYMNEKGKEEFDKAFSPEGIKQMNMNIETLNNGKPHQPIYKVRLYTEGEGKFNVGTTGNKKDKFVVAAKGTNLFFAIYWDAEKQQRNYESISLEKVIEHQKQMAELPKKERTSIPIDASKGEFLFSLSPNDLVYVPTNEELENPHLVNFHNPTKEQVERIYKMVSSTGSECHFIQEHISSLIHPYSAKTKMGELGSLNKMEKSLLGMLIKGRCWKLQVDRLGNIKSVIR